MHDYQMKDVQIAPIRVPAKGPVETHGHAKGGDAATISSSIGRGMGDGVSLLVVGA